MRMLKRILSTFLSVALLLSLCACGEDHTVEYVQSTEHLLQYARTELPDYAISSKYLETDHRFVVEATINRDFYTALVEEKFSDQTPERKSLITKALIATMENKNDKLDTLIEVLKNCVAELEDNTDVDVIIFYTDKDGTRHEY